MKNIDPKIYLMLGLNKEYFRILENTVALDSTACWYTEQRFLEKFSITWSEDERLRYITGDIRPFKN